MFILYKHIFVDTLPMEMLIFVNYLAEKISDIFNYYIELSKLEHKKIPPKAK